MSLQQTSICQDHPPHGMIIWYYKRLWRKVGNLQNTVITVVDSGIFVVNWSYSMCLTDCGCVHGVCDNRPGSGGVCQSWSCKEGYTGKFCDKTSKNCGLSGLSQYCHQNAVCSLNDTARSVFLAYTFRWAQCNCIGTQQLWGCQPCNCVCMSAYLVHRIVWVM